MANEYKVAEQIGKALVEQTRVQGQMETLNNRMGSNYGFTFKEDATLSNNAGMYTTVMHDTIMQAVVADQRVSEALSLVFINDDLKAMNGAGALKIPIAQPTIAVEISEGGKPPRFIEGTDSVVATPTVKAIGTLVTWQINKRGITDTLRHMLNKGVDAISRKLATDIVEGLAVGADVSNAVTGGISYVKVIDARTNVQNASYGNGVKFGFIADKLVVSEVAYGILQKDDDWKQHVYRTSDRPGEFTVGLTPKKFDSMDIIVTPFLTSFQGMVLDSRNAAHLVRENDLETFEHPAEGHLWDIEVQAMMSYTLIVIYGKAIATINVA